MNTTQQPATQINLDSFCGHLASEYERLFASDPQYSTYAKSHTPAGLARKMTLALDAGNGSKEGKGIKATCKHFGIAHTYTAIRAFLKAQ